MRVCAEARLAPPPRIEGNVDRDGQTDEVRRGGGSAAGRKQLSCHGVSLDHIAFIDLNEEGNVD